MLAARRGHTDCLKNLLNRNADPEIRSSNGFTPLIYAANFFQHECVSILLENGANLNSATNTHVIHEPSGCMTALHYAAYKNDTKIVQILLRAGANTSLEASNGWTARNFAKKDVKKYFDTSTKAYSDMMKGIAECTILRYFNFVFMMN